jgi:hypothetical protein
MGKTPAADWITHQDHMLDVVGDFIDVVAPNERLVVAGSSYGAYLARGLVMRVLFDQQGVSCRRSLTAVPLDKAYALVHP